MIETILIIEDEKPNADRLKRLLKEIIPQADVAGPLDSISDSVLWLEANPPPDLILLDVRLSDGISFEIFKQVPINVPVVFTTAYDEYALKAFSLNSIDYLLKPIEAEELKNAIQKLRTLQPSQNQCLLDLLAQIKPKEYRNRFLLAYRDSYKTVLVEDTLYFYSELKITRVKLSDSTIEIIPTTLEELEQQLDPKVFFRANRQFIVSINAIDRVQNLFNGKLRLTIKNHPEVEVILSREKAQLFKSWMDF